MTPGKTRGVCTQELHCRKASKLKGEVVNVGQVHLWVSHEKHPDLSKERSNPSHVDLAPLPTPGHLCLSQKLKK